VPVNNRIVQYRSGPAEKANFDEQLFDRAVQFEIVRHWLACQMRDVRQWKRTRETRFGAVHTYTRCDESRKRQILHQKDRIQLSQHSVKHLILKAI
jgi:hypothetical protein